MLGSSRTQPAVEYDLLTKEYALSFTKFNLGTIADYWITGFSNKNQASRIL
jgi:hypothetical protein